MGELKKIKKIGFIGLGYGFRNGTTYCKTGCNVLGYDIKAKIDKSSVKC